MLAQIDPNYKIPKLTRKEAERISLYHAIEPLKREPRDVKITPEKSKGRWLLPIEDLHNGNPIEEAK